MERAIVTLSYVPVRSEPSEKSELVTQLLFGELYEIIEENKNWLRIKNIYDNYEGWISSECHFNNISDTQFINSLIDSELIINKKLIVAIDLKNESLVYISPGSVFYKKLFIDENIYKLYNNLLKIEMQNFISYNDKEILLQFINTPYLWGGRTIFGIDCSALVQIIFRILGINLPRDAYLQYDFGSIVDSEADLKPYDVAFFGNTRITHTGILLNKTTILHSSGKVCIDRFEMGRGIFNNSTGQLSHKIVGVKRFLS